MEYKLELISIAGMITGFGCFCVYMGHNTTVTSGVFVGLGLIAGYIVGKKP